jgi:hypothetical protein
LHKLLCKITWAATQQQRSFWLLSNTISLNKREKTMKQANSQLKVTLQNQQSPSGLRITLQALRTSLDFHDKDPMSRVDLIGRVSGPTF